MAQTSSGVLDRLADLLAMEIAAVNQYFIQAKMCEAWGYQRLADRFRKTAFDEMRDAEELVERILYFEGTPNLQRIVGDTLGSSVAEQLRLQLDTERNAVRGFSEAAALCFEDGDLGTREFLARRLSEEEKHVDWLETQLSLIEQIGEANYLAQQVREG